MAKRTEEITVQILRQIRDELKGLNGRVDELNDRVDGLTAETRSGFAKLRQEIHEEIVGQRRLHRLETKHN